MGDANGSWLGRRTWAAIGTSLALAACTGGEFLAGGSGGGGGSDAGPGPVTTSTGDGTTSTGSTTSTGGSCDGCLDGGECVPGDSLDACGSDGGACEVCEPGDQCSVPSCGGSCERTELDDGTPCDSGGGQGSGECRNGTCEEAAENCLDGVDNDDPEDELADCLDPDCGAYECVPPTPDGWSGPFAVYEGEQVGCPSAWGLDQESPLSSSLKVPDFTCPTCECTVGDCSVFVDYSAGLGDGLGCGWGEEDNEVFALTEGNCVVTNGSTPERFRNPTTVAECTGSSEEPDITPASLEKRISVCASPSDGGAGCDGGSVCLPKAPEHPDAVGRVCVAMAGDHECPAGFDATKIPAAVDLMDERGCAACGCEEWSCGGSVGIFTDANCSDCNATDGSCAELAVDVVACTEALLGSVTGLVYYAEWAPNGEPTCSASEAAPTGEVSLVTPVTICCR